MLKFKEALFLSLILFGCSTANTNPGATFLFGLNGYQGEMERLSSRNVGFDRRRAGFSANYLVTFGGSEFNTSGSGRETQEFLIPAGLISNSSVPRK
jgi:hypothetical protein